MSARLGNGLVTAPTITAAIADDWILVAFTKPTGTSAVRFHKYVFATNTWTHETGGTNANPTAPSTGPFLGSIGATNQLDGDIAAAAIWSQIQLTDAQVESLVASVMAWWEIAPTGMWILDQATVAQPVRDLTGNGASQNAITGTIVAASSCPLGYGHPVLGA